MKTKMLFQNFCFRQLDLLRSATAMLALILFACPLWAQFMVQPVNLAYLSQRADIIMQGRVTKVVEEPMPGYANIPTVAVTLAVDQMLRGNASKIYTYREVVIGPKIAKRNYRVGQQLFLFLPSPSHFGLSSPIGLGQGRFRIAKDASGAVTVMNEQNNMGLFRNLDRDVRKAGKQLTASQRQLVATERGPVALDQFISLVKSLTTLPRIL